MDTTPRDLDALLAHSGWAKALARNLVRDPDRADDLVQRAWLAAMRRPPSDGTPPRRWLATVLRNFVRQDARESSRREQREHAVARSERAAGTDPVDDAAALQVRLITAVRELPEPYRSAVWARYYDGLAPREIAARDGVSVDTVKTQLARGLDLLRKRFDREHGGDRSAWMAAFVPFAAPELISTATIGAVLMGAKVKAAVAAAVVCSAVTWFTVTRDDVEPTSTLAASTAIESELESEPERESPLAVASERGARTPNASTAAVEDFEESNVPAPEVRGRVLDLEGRPVEGLEIGPARQNLSSNDRSAADGSFSILREFAGHALEATGPGWATVWVDRIPQIGSNRRVTILVARAGQMSGSVLDDEARPVEDAVIEVRFDEKLLRTLGGLLDADPHRLGYSTVSDAEGRFDLGLVPIVAGTIHADVDGRATRPVSIPHAAQDDLVLALDPPDVGDIVVRGTVGSGPDHLVNPDHRVSGAHVRIGAATQRTDRDGAFRLVVRPTDVRADGMPIELMAVSENQCPTKVAFPSRGELAYRAATETFDIVLGDDPLIITGRVVDADGNPMVGARLRANEDWFGTVSVGKPGQPARHDRTVEAILRGDRGPDVASGSDGLFTLYGLQARDYRIVISSREPLAMNVIEHVPAGTNDLLVVLDTRGPRKRVAGRVVDGAGRAVAGSKVTAEVDLGFENSPLTSSATTTDALGAFELNGLRGRIVKVLASFDASVAAIGVKHDTVLDDVRIVVPRPRAVQVDITSKPDLATDFRIHNARGRVAMHSSWTVASRTVSRGSERVAVSLPIVDGRSDVVTVHGDELTLVLLRDGTEVAQIPIVFASEGVTIVRP